MINLPFNPIKRAKEIENMVMQGLKRKYHRFRPAPYYGGIATADAVGCCFLCAYCWSYFRILNPERHGKFYSSDVVAGNLVGIAKNKGFEYVRVTGCEPILGKQSLAHLAQVIRLTHEVNKDLVFVLETNGLLLGYYPDFIKQLKNHQLTIRVAIKGWDPISFQNITGADKEYFKYPLMALQNMRKEGLDAWPAVMLDVFGREGVRQLKDELKSQGIDCSIETEELERYPYVMENIEKRGVVLK